jgi:hypothetical protein
MYTVETQYTYETEYADESKQTGEIKYTGEADRGLPRRTEVPDSMSPNRKVYNRPGQPTVRVWSEMCAV